MKKPKKNEKYFTKKQLRKLCDLIAKDGKDNFVNRFKSDYRTKESAEKWWQRFESLVDDLKDAEPNARALGYRKLVFNDIAKALDKTAKELGEAIGFEIPVGDDDEADPVRMKSRARLHEIFDSGDFYEAQFSNWLGGQSKDYISALPAPIHRAIGALHGAWESGTAVQPKDFRRVFLGTADQSHPEFRVAQKALADLIRSEVFPDAQPPCPSDDFGAMLSPETGMFYPQMFLFPVTQSKTRRAFFGVLPFAKQTKIGFVMSRKHPAYEWLEGHNTKPIETVSRKDRLLEMTEGSVDWLSEIVTTTNKKGGKIYSASGDVQSLMLMEALHNQKDKYLVASKSLGLIQKKPSRYGNELEGFFEGDQLGTHSVFIFDPWEWRRLNLKSGFVAILCPHEVDVDVGVGFSLNLLPRLLMGEQWRKILSTAWSNYGEKKSALHEIGVEMLPENKLFL